MEVGRIHLSVAPKDVFSMAEMKNTIKYLEDGAYKIYKHDCITTVRVAAEKLLGVNLKGAIKQNSFNIWDFEEYLKKKGFLKERIDINLTHDKKTGEVYSPVNEDDKASFKFDKSIKNNLGYHIYSVGYHIHTETFVIYNKLSNSEQTMYWQGGIRQGNDWKDLPLKVVDESIRLHIKSWSLWCFDHYGYYKSYAFFLKLQRVILILLICISGMHPINIYAFDKSIIYNAEITDSILISSDKDSLRYTEIYRKIEAGNFKTCKFSDVDVHTAKYDELDEFHFYNIVKKTKIFFDSTSDIDKPMYALIFYEFEDECQTKQYAKTIFEVRFKDYMTFPMEQIKTVNICFRIYVYKNTLYVFQNWECGQETNANFRSIIMDCDKMQWDNVYK